MSMSSSQKRQTFRAPFSFREICDLQIKEIQKEMRQIEPEPDGPSKPSEVNSTTSTEKNLLHRTSTTWEKLRHNCNHMTQSEATNNETIGFWSRVIVENKRNGQEYLFMPVPTSIPIVKEYREIKQISVEAQLQAMLGLKVGETFTILTTKEVMLIKAIISPKDNCEEILKKLKASRSQETSEKLVGA